MKIRSLELVLIGFSSCACGQPLRRRAQSILPVLDAADDHYETIKDTRLDVKAPGILENDLSGNPIVVVDHTEFGTGNNFQGKLKVYEDGRIRYDPKKGFLGTESFMYEACEVIDGEISSICDSAVVSIDVIEDPDRPSSNPKAVDDRYDAIEGRKLSIKAPGFLENDEHEKGKPIYRDKQTSKPKGDLKTHSDGRFDYTAPKCWTGDDSFGYRVCYADFTDVCDEAKVTISVKEDTSNRPDPPRTQDNKYSLHENEELDVSRSSGVLSNDRPDKGQELYVKDYKEESGFQGSLRVRSDGRVQYTPVVGETGSFWFTYTACYSEWSCVECRDAKVEIQVEKDQSQPNQTPRVRSNTYETLEDTTLEVSASNGVLSNDEHDERYSLRVDTSSYRYSGNGEFRIRSDGRVIYTPVTGFTGTETFSYIACYNDFPDICSSRGEGTLIIKADTSKPNQTPRVRSNTYETLEDTTLEVSASNGVLSNDEHDERYSLRVDTSSYRYSGNGEFRIRSDGRVIYTPVTGFTGTETFSYIACYNDFPDVCSSRGEGTLIVKADTSKPNQTPRVRSNTYETLEDTTLEVSASNGVLSNDEHDERYSLRVDTSSYRYSGNGEFRIRSDGRVIYTPVTGFTGTETFSYIACYNDFPDVCSSRGEGTLIVKSDPSRPNQTPRVRSNTYGVIEDTTLEVSVSNGVLSNDEHDERYSLRVDTSSYRYSGEGEFRIRSDGRVIYTPLIGFTGTETFSYKSCYQEFPEICSSRGEGALIVRINPNKPTSRIEPSSKAYEIEAGATLEVSASSGVLSGTTYDDRYTPFVDSYDYSGDGSLTIRSDGRVVYTPAIGFLGTEAFGFTICYREWEDRRLCGHSFGTLNVVKPSPPSSDDSVSRRGVATAYAVRWDATSWKNNCICEDVVPSLELSCAGDGELSLLDLPETDTTNCTHAPLNGTVTCSGENEGIVYVECRDGRADNSTNRELTVVVESEPVHCGVNSTEGSFAMYWTYHAAQILTHCEDSWVYRGMNCTGDLRNTTWENTVCYGEDMSTGNTSMPEALVATSLNYEACIHTF